MTSAAAAAADDDDAIMIRCYNAFAGLYH